MPYKEKLIKMLVFKFKLKKFKGKITIINLHIFLDYILFYYLKIGILISIFIIIFKWA